VRHQLNFPLLTTLALIFTVTASTPAAAQQPEWTQPFPPFRIAGNLYYVGSTDIASFLITTPRGNILINSGLEASVPLIKSSIEQLGFNFADTRILLISHAHWDHDAGSAAIKAATGATYMVMDADVPTVESGGAADFQYGSDLSMRYPPIKVDRILHDGDKVTLGGVTLVAHLTPGHTKGCTTWTMNVTEGGKIYHVEIICGPNVSSDYKLIGNAAYPAIVSDYQRMFRVLKTLPCDIFLGAHGSYFDLVAKYGRFNAGATDAFVDPKGCAAFIADREMAFNAELARQTPAVKR
jgi:metallo-beta-lactamase class B